MQSPYAAHAPCLPPCTSACVASCHIPTSASLLPTCNSSTPQWGRSGAVTFVAHLLCRGGGHFAEDRAGQWASGLELQASGEGRPSFSSLPLPACWGRGWRHCLLAFAPCMALGSSSDVPRLIVKHGSPLPPPHYIILSIIPFPSIPFPHSLFFSLLLSLLCSSIVPLCLVPLSVVCCCCLALPVRHGRVAGGSPLPSPLSGRKGGPSHSCAFAWRGALHLHCCAALCELPQNSSFSITA